MSEGSLPPFKYLDPRRYPAKLRDVAGRLIERFRRGGKLWSESGTASGPAERPAGASETITYPEGRGINADGDRASTPHPDQASRGEEVGEADRERATAALREFLAENTTNVERAARMRTQAERLEREGTPSDSAQNRAERARVEVIDGLVRLRRSLSASGEDGPARALESEVTKLDPPVRPGEIRR